MHVARSTGPHPGVHTGGRKKLLPGLPSMTSLVGVAVLAIAAVGATVSQEPVAAPAATPAASDFAKLSSQASVLNTASTGGFSNAMSGRARAVSRDSQRQALQEVADAELQAAAESKARERNAALAQLAASAEEHAGEIAERIAQRLWALPLPAGSYRLTSRFGECSALWSNCHTGLDFAAPSGTPVLNMAAGVVTETGYDGSYGNRTIVRLPDGTEVWYCHQTSFTVAEGESVGPGEQIGTVGSTGNSTGPHLHLEVHPGAGDAVDPMGAAAVRGLQF